MLLLLGTVFYISFCWDSLESLCFFNKTTRVFFLSPSRRKAQNRRGRRRQCSDVAWWYPSLGNHWTKVHVYLRMPLEFHRSQVQFCSFHVNIEHDYSMNVKQRLSFNSDDTQMSFCWIQCFALRKQVGSLTVQFSCGRSSSKIRPLPTSGCWPIFPQPELPINSAIMWPHPESTSFFGGFIYKTTFFWVSQTSMSHAELDDVEIQLAEHSLQLLQPV